MNNRISPATSATPLRISYHPALERGTTTSKAHTERITRPKRASSIPVTSSRLACRAMAWVGEMLRTVGLPSALPAAPRG